MISLSPRARITLGSTAVAAVLLVLALLLVRGQVGAILSNADESLAISDLSSFQQDISAHPNEPVDDPGTGVLAYVRDPSGMGQVNTLPHDVQFVVENRPASSQEFTMTDDEGRTFVVVGRSVSTETGTWALWSARSTSASELALEGFDHILLVGGLALLTGFAAASWVIATLALRPVEAARARETQMVSDAAHELRTPLASLKTQLELAHDDFGDARALAGQVTRAEASVDRLTSLASNLLELSRLESGTRTTTLTTANLLADELTASVDRARMLALAKSVTIDFDIVATTGDGEFRIDPQSFGRLSDNLFSNAISATGEHGEVMAALDFTGQGLTLAVSDNGPGMPEGFLPIAFDRFTRPDESRTSSTGGGGLGLALVRALARDAGGDVVAQNTRPGLRVMVSIPKM